VLRLQEDDTQHPLVLYGKTHSFLATTHNGIYTEKTAAGFIIAMGASAVTLRFYRRRIGILIK